MSSKLVSSLNEGQGDLHQLKLARNEILRACNQIREMQFGFRQAGMTSVADKLSSIWEPASSGHSRLSDYLERQEKQAGALE